jgi:hypothetical protein
VVVGVYDDTGGHPGNLLGRATISAPHAGWNTVTVPTILLTAGRRYWIALLSPAGAGTVAFADRAGKPAGPSETSKRTDLTDLPTAWVTGATYQDAPLSAFGP